MLFLVSKDYLALRKSDPYDGVNEIEMGNSIQMSALQ